MTVAQIARAWGFARQSVQRVTDALARDGLVAYQENPAHRRAQLVRLTPRGRQALRRIQAAQREWANALGDRVGAKDLQTANRILARVIEALTDAG
jgi:DNA-binding MarR family transcriptional regulator